MGNQIRAWIALWAIVLGPAATAAQRPDAGSYSPARYQVVEARSIMVPMRDGVRISVDLYRPDAPGRHAGILSITPYDNNSLKTRARWFAARGYVVAAVDSRGRYDSEGHWDPFTPNHKTDGYDLVEWMAKQSWSNARIGMIGGSYGGWTQWWTASQAPPSLKAIAPQVAPPDQLENIPYQNGIMLGPFVDWAAWMSGRTGQIVDTGAYGGYTVTRARDLWHTPYLTLNEARGPAFAPWWETWIRANVSTHPYWQAIAYQGPERYAKMTVPALNLTGWFDADFPGSPMNYLGMKAHAGSPEGRRPKLIIGPWYHGLNERVVGGIDYGPDAVIDLDGYITRWFDHYLKEIDNGVVDDPPVWVFVMGPNRWYPERDWPLPQTRWTPYYLTSGGRANSLEGDGLLTTVPPPSDRSDGYTYDPDRPTRSPYGTHGHIPGVVDTRLGARGDEVLVYQTPPLTEDVEVTGPIEARLFAATSARDTDWMLRLVDVSPDGFSALLGEGVMRARHRDPAAGGQFNPAQLSTIEPGRVYEYRIKFWRVTGNVFSRGHRIRLEISSSYYPFYLRNLNSDSDNAGLATKPVVATQRVHHGRAYPSQIVLPVIPSRANPRS
ncbi:MAG: CocE/NonD family hydrolase [Gemmatimonadetes bacterium]|nr:CocE/NonD family hydrolase [Gemmatimonadota bacterium]